MLSAYPRTGNPTASRQCPGKVSGESREPYCGTPEYTLQPSGPPESEPAILKEPAMNELHLRETAALELASPMTLPQQNAGIPPLSPEMDPSNQSGYQIAAGTVRSRRHHIFLRLGAAENRSTIRSVYRLHLSQTTSRGEKRIGNGALLAAKKQEVKDR